MLPNGTYTNRPNYDVTWKHDGIHIWQLGNEPVPVTLLPAMKGTVTAVKEQDSRLSRVDVRLDQPINGETYYMILKDLNADSLTSAVGGKSIGSRKLRVNGTEQIGTVRGNPSIETPDWREGYEGLHFTLISEKNYKTLVRNIRNNKPSDPKWYMNAATDPRSPFRCP